MGEVTYPQTGHHYIWCDKCNFEMILKEYVIG